MFERELPDTSCVLVHAETSLQVGESDETEFLELSRSAGLEPRAHLRFHRRTPHPRFFFGRGQTEQIGQCCLENEVQLVVINADPSPSQERNLEQQLQCRVLGRTGLILDIFAQRARSHEGKLQVELAQLDYLSTRLVRGWSHLERQKGGIGLRGPGETQLESDRRLLTRRLQNLRRRLALVRRQRQQSRARRQRDQSAWNLALVGYTNAGKSTLFNVLTNSEVHTANQLFATLDPTHRRMTDLGDRDVVVSDTVGFIGRLPGQLVQAFHATLEEICECDLLLHVMDRSSSACEEQAAQVNEVLQEIGAGDIPVIEVYNKMDRTEGRWDPANSGNASRVQVSARTGEGLEVLRERITQRLWAQEEQVQLCLPPEAYSLRAELYRLGRVERERFTDAGECEIRLWLPLPALPRFARFRMSGPTL